MRTCQVSITYHCIALQYDLTLLGVLPMLLLGIADIRTTEHVAQPDQEAMYLLMPTRSNVERIISEFSNGRRQYKKIHLFFVDCACSAPSNLVDTHNFLLTPALSEELFSLLTSSQAEPFLACLTELFVNFWRMSLTFLASTRLLNELRSR